MKVTCVQRKVLECFAELGLVGLATAQPRLAQKQVPGKPERSIGNRKLLSKTAPK
jgi:hypothetical protein